MKVAMRALRRCYVPSLQGEFSPGQTFEAESEREAIRLERRQNAERVNAQERKGVPDPVPLEPAVDTPLSADPVPHPTEVSAPDDIETLRKKYTRMTGIIPDKRWGVSRLTEETNRYNRRDMRAED